MGALVGVAEIADLLGVSRRQVHRLAAQDNFPAPAETVAMGRLWRRSDIERWAAKRRKRGGQEKPYPKR